MPETTVSTSANLTSLRTVRDVFHLLWGPRLHVGVLTDGREDTVPAATARASRIKAEKAQLFEGCRVLEVGCGFGLDARLLAEAHRCLVTATDIEAWRLDQARLFSRDVDGLTFEPADHSSLHYKNATFDLVWATETLSYSPDLQRSLTEVARVLKPGGRLVVADYTCSKLIDPRQIMVLNDTKQLWSSEAWMSGFRKAGLQLRQYEDWSGHARQTYARLAREMLMLDQESQVALASARNMNQRVKLIEAGAFGYFLAILTKAGEASGSHGTPGLRSAENTQKV